MFRVVRLAFDKGGQVSSRTVVSIHQTRAAAETARRAEAARHKPCDYHAGNDHWLITYDRGRKHWLIIEGSAE